jgi:hypothetical protein
MVPCSCEHGTTLTMVMMVPRVSQRPSASSSKKATKNVHQKKKRAN